MRYTGIFFCAILFCCKTPAKKNVLDEFKKVNESLEKSLEGNSYEQNYLLILSQRDKNPGLATHADSLYNAVAGAAKYMDNLKEMLTSADSSGENEIISGKLIAKGARGDTLVSLLKNVYQRAMFCPIDVNKKPDLDSMLSIFALIDTDKNWRSTYFEGAATMQALTILSAFQNYAKNGATLAMADMASKLKQ